MLPVFFNRESRMIRFLSSLMVMGFLVMPAKAETFQADSKLSVTSIIISATNNTAQLITNKPAVVYSVDAANLSTATVFIKLYNSATATCGSGTPWARYSVMSSGNMVANNINGDAYVNGVSVCIVKGLADSSTTAPDAASGTVNIHWDVGPR